MKTTRLILATSVSVSLLLAAPAVAATGGGGGQPAPNSHALEVSAHWTPERKAAAVPRDFVLDAAGGAYIDRGNGQLQPYGHGRAAGATSPAPQPAGKPDGGSKPTIISSERWTGGGQVETAAGRLYFEMPNATTGAPVGYVCSGTAVTDRAVGSSLILTAAHCVYDDVSKVFADNVMFIPDQDATTGQRTDGDCFNDPLGCWVPSHGVVDLDWTTRTFPDNIPWDYGLYVVPGTGAHVGTGSAESLEAAAGTLPVQFSPPGARAFTDAFGYSYNRDPNLMYCAQDMSANGPDNWWLSKCRLTGGSSGGPWIQPLVAGAGPVISVNSWGYAGGPGMAGPKLSGTTARCIYDAADGSNDPGDSNGIIVTVNGKCRS